MNHDQTIVSKRAELAVVIEELERHRKTMDREGNFTNSEDYTYQEYLNSQRYDLEKQIAVSRFEIVKSATVIRRKVVTKEQAEDSLRHRLVQSKSRNKI